MLIVLAAAAAASCSDPDPVMPQDEPLTPDSPEGREEVAIPDARFRAYMLENFDADGDGRLSRYEASLVERIDCEGDKSLGGIDYISDATGIEACTNLRFLNLAGNGLTGIDLSGNKLLDTLQIAMNYDLKSLDVSQNTNLEQLMCFSCSLDGLDVTANTELRDLRCGGDGVADHVLDVLDCRNNRKLEILMAGTCQMSEIHLDCPDLLSLDLHENQIAELDIAGCHKFMSVNVYNNRISQFELQCPDLTFLRCDGNDLETLDVSDCPKLNIFYCYGNRLRELDLSNNDEIMYLNISDNQLTAFDASCLPLLVEFGCYNNKLENLLIASHEIVQLRCQNNNIAELDLTGLETLEYLDCQGNKMVSLAVDSPKLMTLDCQNNALRELDLSKLQSLQLLNCQENLLEILDLSLNGNMLKLSCNPMETLKTIYLAEGQNIRVIDKPETAEIVYKQ